MPNLYAQIHLRYNYVPTIRNTSPHESVSCMMFINLDSDIVCISTERFSSLLDEYETYANKSEKEISGMCLSIASALRLPRWERGGERKGNGSHPPHENVNFASAPTCRHRPSDAQDASLCLKSSLAATLADIYGTTWWQMKRHW